MGKVYCLLGKNGVGKSKIEKELCKFGFIRMIVITLRHIKQENKQGLYYNYLPDKNSNKLLKECYYEIDKDFNSIDLKNNNYICIIKPNEYEQIIKNIGKENVVGIYIYIHDKERLLRLLNVEETPNCYEICRGFISDIDLFDKIENKVDYIIKNDNVNKSIRLIFEQIGINYSPILPKTKIYKNSKVRVIQINSNKANHLKKYIGKIGEVIANHLVHNEKRRYKVLFKFNNEVEIAYFRDRELELVKI